MDELIQTKMHEALEVEQPDGGMRSRILSSLPAGGPSDRARKGGITPMGRRTELAAAIAALLLAAIVIGSFAYSRAFSRTHNVSPPKPSPTLTQPLKVDAATPVILFNDGGKPNQIDGMTWDGQRAGKITEIPPPRGDGGPPLSSAQSSSPAGTLFVAFPYFYDRSGTVVATLKGGPYADPGVGMYFVGTWADDSLHYCQLVPIFGGASAVTGTLQLTTPGDVPRDVVRIGMQAAGVNTLTASVCSVLADRAVVIQADSNFGPNGRLPLIQYWVVELSTGRVLSSHDLRGKGIANVVASRDVRYVAEVQSTGTTTVYETNGSPVGNVDGWIQGFSWDGSLAVVTGDQGRATVVRWSDGKVIWTLPPDDRLSSFQPQPGGTSLAIKTINGILYLVASDGRVVAKRQLSGAALLACPRGCVSAAGSDVMQVIPRVIVGNVGWADGLQRTTDGGLHWQSVSPPTPPNRTKGGYTSFVLDVDHAWTTVATGDVALRNATKLVIFATADGGQTWSQGSVPMTGVVNSRALLGFVDARHGWLVTDSGAIALDKSNTSMVSQPLNRAIYSTTDGGANWSRLVSAQEGDGSTLGTLALGCSMSGLTFTNPNLGWLTWNCNEGMGSPRAQLAQSLVATTRDGGRTWQAVNLPSNPDSSYICSASPPVFTMSEGVIPMFCGGIGHPGFSAVYTTSDGGRGWSLHKTPFFAQQMNFVDANTGWTFGTTGVNLYRTTNGGRNWAVIKQFAPEQNVTGFRFLDSKSGYLITTRYAPDMKSGFSTMWKTTDGGSTWSVVNSKPTGPGGCC